ncbi:hypothetical protein BH23GEM3_BH23GEM3_22110 [soil metagenome]
MASAPPQTSSSAEARMREAFESRMQRVIHDVAQRAEIEVIAAVLAEAGSISALASALTHAAELDPPGDPLAAARARGASARERLLQKAGGVLRVSEAAGMLGVTRTAVNARRTRGTLLAVPLPNGEHVYPACQFTEKGAPGGLGRFLSAFHEAGPWTQLSVLLAPSSRHGGKTALELLKDGEVEEAVGIARRHGEHLG